MESFESILLMRLFFRLVYVSLDKYGILKMQEGSALILFLSFHFYLCKWWKPPLNKGLGIEVALFKQFYSIL